MRPRLALLPFGLVLAVAVSATGAVIPPQAPDLPVLQPETPKGSIVTADATPVTPSPKTVDGDPSDWIGTSTRLGGTAITSAGEFVYQDFPNDDWGADDGRDAERLAVEDPLRELEPRTYKLDSLAQVLGDEIIPIFGDPAEEVLDRSPFISALLHYGDAAYPEALRNHADIEEVRVAADTERLLFLVRTHLMSTVPGTAVLILLDTEPGGEYPAPGEITTGAELAMVFAGNSLIEYRVNGEPAVPPPAVCDDAGCTFPYEVATNAAGFANAMEIMLRPSRFGFGGLDEVKVGVATGIVNAEGAGLADVSTGEAAADLINVAFRFDEPVRTRMDKEQALALLGGSMDKYLATIDLGRLRAGATESFEMRPGYYDRVYVSDSPVVAETESSQEIQGVFQHYGVYIPTSYVAGTPSPATVWIHSRTSATTHLAGAWVPGIIAQLGEDRGNIIIAPSARGSSTWYVGRGHEDFLESWDDAMASFSIDPDRVYLSGHSMGGFGSYLLGLLYPDRFAAVFPISAATTQGGWLGVRGPIAPQDGSEVEDFYKAEFMYDLIENARNVPYVIYQGQLDELVHTPGVVRMAARFTELGYRNRLYQFPAQEHYSILVVDEWQEAARYLDRFRREENPARVTYKIRPKLERAVEMIRLPEGLLDYTFDGAYWVDGMTVRDGDPSLETTMGTIDATSFAIPAPQTVGVPEAGVVGLGQSSPYLMTGLQWLGLGTSTPRNAFEAMLENLATARLDVSRMALATAETIEASVTTDGPATLMLAGSWTRAPSVTGADESYDGSVLTLTLSGAGTHAITIAP